MSDIVRLANEQQRLAADPEAHVFVEANAGSGKTKVLVDRVSRLLLGGSAPDRILCLTYTKAAAGEMKDRLFARLGEWAVADDAALAAALGKLEGDKPPTAEMLAQARRLFARALETPGGLKVQTIHAFCESLIRRFPLEAGAPPGFEVADDAAAALIEAEARASVLGQVGRDEALGAALDIVIDRGASTLEEVFAFIRSKRRKLSEYLDASGGLDGAAEALRAALGVARDETEPGCISGALEAIGAGWMPSAIEAMQAGGKTDREQAALLQAAWRAETPEARFGALYGLCFTGQDTPRAKPPGSAALRKAAPEIGARLDELFATIQAAQRRLNAIRCLGRSRAVLVLAERYASAYESALSAARRLDFDDLIARARDLLTRSEAADWVRYKLDGGVDHILVDEAQDTAPEQWEVINALAEEFFAGRGAQEGGRTQFCVGDEKQSIYSFQGADPKRFVDEGGALEGRASAGAGLFRRPGMDVSFRSAKGVLRAVDAVFEAIAPPEPSEAGAEFKFLDLEAAARPFQRYQPHTAFRDKTPGAVELWPPIAVPEQAEESDPFAPVDSERPGSPRNVLAEMLAEEIGAMIARGDAVWHEVEDEDGKRWEQRPATAGDVIILVRRRDGFFEELIRQLKRRRIPVAGADRMVLQSQTAVRDLIALMRFATCPDDDLSLAELLKSPLFHPAGEVRPVIDDDALYDLTAWSDPDRRRPRLWTLLKESEDGRFAEAKAALASVLDQADITTPHALLTGFLGGRSATGETRMARMVARLGEEARDPIGEFLTGALAHERDGAPSLVRFLARTEGDERQIKRELEAAGDAVRVMTVHASKGLEAPIVILPDTTQTPKGRAKSGLFEFPPAGVVWSPKKAQDPSLAEALREEDSRLAHAEYLRLLYVALTRARDRLIVCGWRHGGRSKANPEGKVEADSWYARVERAWGALDDAERFETPAGPGLRLGDAPPQLGAASGRETARAVLPDWALRDAPEEPASPRPIAPSRLVEEDGESEPAGLSPLLPDAAWRFRRGDLIHKLLQILPDLPADRRASAAERYLAAQSDLDEAGRAAIAAETMAVLTHPDFAPIFGPGSRAEVALSGRLDSDRAGRFAGRAVHGQVDRLVVTDHEVLIVDYKTNRPPPENYQDVARIYRIQMAVYRALLQSLHPDRPVRCALLWTDTPRFMELPSDWLETSLTGAAA